jgi:sulfur carrier protein ThiS
MKIRVYLFGTFRQCAPGHDAAKGMEIHLPDGANAGALLKNLEIPEKAGAVVVMNNRVIQRNEPIEPDAMVRIVQTAAGG